MESACVNDLRGLCKEGAMPIPEACGFLGVSRTTIYALMKEKKLIATKVNGRTLILRSSATSLLASGIIAAA